MTQAIRKKLIEVSIPLEAINAASSREKSIRHGHPSTLHLWWARRPLAACRAVLFAQLVDDPSSWPERFPTVDEQDAERRRLHKVIEALVPWEASNDEAILDAARWEIARSVAWGLGEEPPARGDGPTILDYLQTKAPPVYDPFSGGGSIPLEAQRLGLRAYGSDLNPVAVLIGKALVEIPPKFAGRPPVNPKAQAEIARGGAWNGKGAQGLAEDVRYYGQWMRDEAERRIGHLYPKAKLPDGSEATVIAWLWARTVRSPDPAAKGAMVPLVSSFMLSTKEGRKAWVEVVIDRAAQDGWRFEVRTGTLSRADEERLSEGTKTGRGQFRCILTGSIIANGYIKSEAEYGTLFERLMTVVVQERRSRSFLVADELQDLASKVDRPDIPQLAFRLAQDGRALTPVLYGLNHFYDQYTPRQLAALDVFSTLVENCRLRVNTDSANVTPLAESNQYAEAIATYLALCASKMAVFLTTQARWRPGEAKTAPGFGRSALPMVWDFAEINPFAGAGGDWLEVVNGSARAISEQCSKSSIGQIEQADARRPCFESTVISTDPPYYDNVGYSDLSDYFYVWLRRSLANTWPELLRRVLTPKSEEIVVASYRNGGVLAAERYFMEGMSAALTAIGNASFARTPLAIYYAFKQAESTAEGTASSGWASFLEAIIAAGLVIEGTCPCGQKALRGSVAKLQMLSLHQSF